MLFFFFNDTATTEIYTLSLHDALPIWRDRGGGCAQSGGAPGNGNRGCRGAADGADAWLCRCRGQRAPGRPAPPHQAAHVGRSEEHTSELQSRETKSYAVFCLKKKNIPHSPLPFLTPPPFSPLFSTSFTFFTFPSSPYPPSIPADVNSNFSLANRNVTSHWRKVKHSHSPVSPLNELLLDENVVADIVSDECADVKKRKPDTTQCSLIATKSLFDAKLPPELKLKIFSYLNQREKGQCMFVSTEWNSIIRSPELWQHVNLREFRLCYGHGDTSGSAHVYDGPDTAMDTSSYSQCTQQCYGSYINRIENYISFLIDIQPKVKRLEFSFDLIEDNWMATVDRLFHLNMSELRYADINWRDTPTKPSYLSSPNQNLNDVKYKTRRRCRKFLSFLEEFVEEAPNLQSLVVPFEWSSRSMKALLSLKRLKNLALEIGRASGRERV